MDEHRLIATIKKALGPMSSAVETGIGDDCAVVRSFPGKMLLTMDSLVEDVHFDRRYSRAEEIGHKLLAVNASDIASMGGFPRYAMVSLVLSNEASEKWVEGLYRGIRALASELKIDVVGGNVARSLGGSTLEICLVGEASENVLQRKGARAGNLIAVTGSIGSSAAGLALLRRDAGEARTHHGTLVEAHLRPTPRVLAGQALARTGAVTSAIDVSDGLVSELHHLAKSSGVQMIADLALLPVSENARKAALLTGGDVLDWALNGGEDYEILFTFDPTARETVEKVVADAGDSMTVIGRVETGEGVFGISPEGEKEVLSSRGWKHFSAPVPG